MVKQDNRTRYTRIKYGSEPNVLNVTRIQIYHKR